MADPPLYDTIGTRYSATRREDPRLAAAIHEALGDATSVLNVGAGSGAYEPRDRRVVAIEPSSVMLAQRPAGAPPAIQGHAESLPFEDRSFDAVMAVFTDHHWRDRGRAFRELARVARDRAVFFNADPAEAHRFWLTTEYVPGSRPCDRTSRTGAGGPATRSCLRLRSSTSATASCSPSSGEHDPASVVPP